MKVEAFRCDLCNSIYSDIEFVKGYRGEESLFNRTELSFPETKTPEGAPFHFCLNCYQIRVVIPAANTVNRAKDEAGYKDLLKDLYYSMKRQGIVNSLPKQGKK